MNLFALSGLLTGITSLSISLFVYLKQRRTLLNKVWIVLALSVAIWGFGCYKMASTTDEREAFLWYRLAHIGVILIPVSVYHFVFVFLNLKKKTILKAVYFTGSIFFIANLIDLFNSYFLPDKAHYLIIAHMKWIFNSFYMDTPPGPIYPLFVLFFFMIIGDIYYELFKALKENVGIRKAQIKYFFLATLIGFIGGGTSFFPVFGVNIYPIGNFGTAIYPLVITYAILTHKLMDIEVVIKKTLVFAGIFTAAYGVFTAITFLGQAIFEELTGGSRWIALIPSIAIIVLMLRPLENFLIKVTDKFLFQKKYDYRQLIRQFMDELKTMVLNAQDIAQSTLDFLNSSIRPETSVIFMHNKFINRYDIIASVDFHDISFKIPDNALFIEKLQETGEIINLKRNKSFSDRELKELEAMGIHLVVPLIIHKELLGILGLGKKKSDEEYTEEDIEALSNLSSALSIAINNAQLFDERADAEKRAMIGTLATGINHEIGNPLNVIAIKLQSFQLLSQRGLLEKRSKEEIIDEVNAITKTCLENAQRISDITKKVSEFAKPDKKLALDRVNIGEAINETVSVFEHELVLDRIKLEKNIACESPYIVADGGQLKQILFNLIKNAAQAIQATKRDDGKIVISVDKHGEQEISLKISDNGPGIPAKDLDKIFMPFYTTKEPGKGTGLGLALVSRLVERNDAKIEVKSEEGKGATFTVVFKGKPYE